MDDIVGSYPTNLASSFTREQRPADRVRPLPSDGDGSRPRVPGNAGSQEAAGSRKDGPRRRRHEDAARARARRLEVALRPVDAVESGSSGLPPCSSISSVVETTGSTTEGAEVHGGRSIDRTEKLDTL